MFRVWQEQMLERRKQNKDLKGLEDLLNVGFYLSKLIRFLNQILSPFLFIDMIVFMTSAVMWCYTSSAFLFHLEALNQSYKGLFYCLTSLGKIKILKESIFEFDTFRIYDHEYP